MVLQIPDSELQNIRGLLALKPDELDQLADKLVALTECYSTNQLLRKVASECAAITPEAAKVANVFVSLRGTANRSSDSPQEVVEKFRRTIESHPEIEVPDGYNWPESVSQITRVLNESRAVQAASKALELLFFSENHYISAKVSSDLRPILVGKNSDEVSGFFLLTTLKLAYNESDELTDFNITMDEDDLRQLRKVLDEAIAERSAIERLMSEKELNLVELD